MTEEIKNRILRDFKSLPFNNEQHALTAAQLIAFRLRDEIRKNRIIMTAWEAADLIGELIREVQIAQREMT